jgi:SNARE protein
MSDLSFTDKDMSDRVSDLTRKVGALSSAKGDARREGIDECEELIRKIKDLRKGFNLELQPLEKGTKKREYQSKLKGYDKEVAHAKENLGWARQQSDKQQLFDGARGDQNGDPRTMGNDSMLAATSKIQDKTDVSLERTLADAHMGLKIGTETAATLQEQTEQLGGIGDDAKEIREQLRTADALIKNFAKRMATDKIIQCFLFLVTIAIVVIIVYATAYPDQTEFSVPDEVKPPGVGPSESARRLVTGSLASGLGH